MPVINGIYLKDFTALPGAVADANIIPIAITGDQVAYKTTVAGIITDARVTSKLLTGLSVTGGAIASTDSILTAFGKVQNQVNNRVPYTGATGAVDLGAFDLTVNGLKVGRGGGSQNTNTLVGNTSFQNNTTGGFNSVFGFNAMPSNTTGGSNTAIGSISLNSNGAGFNNTAVGNQSLRYNTSGQQNTAVGVSSMFSNTLGSGNTAVGDKALYGNVDGSYNTAIGIDAGGYITPGALNNTSPERGVYIGHFTLASAADNTNEIVIGGGAVGNGSNTVTIGDYLITNNYFTGNIRGGAFIKAGGTSTQFLKADGSIDSNTYLTSDALSGYVPYTGATANVDLGTFDITTDIVNLNQLKAVGSGGLNIYSNSGTHIALMGGGGGAGTTFYGGIIGTSASFSSSGSSDTVGITHSSGSGIALNITKGGNGEGLYINKTSGSGNAATIIGTLEATTLVKSGGTSSQFLKADGSIDSNSYALASALSAYLPLSGGTLTGALGGTSASFSGNGLFGGSTALTGIGGGISVNNSSTSGVQFKISDVVKGFIYATNANKLILDAIASVGIEMYVNASYSTPALSIATTGAATFSSSVTANSSSADGGLFQIFGNNSFLNIGADKGGGAVLKYNSNGNLDITPRSGFNTVFTSGNVGINTTSPTSKLQIVGLPEYATNELAITGGLTVGAFYHTAGVLKVVI
jgi:hypothetical protein